MSQFINLIGAEQKVERFHLHLAHYAKEGMYALSADSLALTGMSVNNCHLHKKLHIGQFNENKRAKINEGFHSWSLHLNHELMHYKNIQAVKKEAPPFKCSK